MLKYIWPGKKNTKPATELNHMPPYGTFDAVLTRIELKYTKSRNLPFLYCTYKVPQFDMVPVMGTLWLWSAWEELVHQLFGMPIANIYRIRTPEDLYAELVTKYLQNPLPVTITVVHEQYHGEQSYSMMVARVTKAIKKEPQ